MTHKSLTNQLDVAIESICTQLDLNPAIAVKGGSREVANSLLHQALQVALPKIIEGIVTRNAAAPAPTVATA